MRHRSAADRFRSEAVLRTGRRVFITCGAAGRAGYIHLDRIGFACFEFETRLCIQLDVPVVAGCFDRNCRACAVSGQGCFGTVVCFQIKGAFVRDLLVLRNRIGEPFRQHAHGFGAEHLELEVAKMIGVAVFVVRLAELEAKLQCALALRRREGVFDVIRRACRKRSAVQCAERFFFSSVKADLVLRLVTFRRQIIGNAVCLSDFRFDAGIDKQLCLPDAAIFRIFRCRNDPHIDAVRALIHFDHIAVVVSFKCGIGSAERESVQRNRRVSVRNQAGTRSCHDFSVHDKIRGQQLRIGIVDFLHVDVLHRDTVVACALAEHELQHDLLCGKAGLGNGDGLRKRRRFLREMLSVKRAVALFDIAVVAADLKVHRLRRRDLRSDKIAFARFRYRTGTNEQLGIPDVAVCGRSVDRERHTVFGAFDRLRKAVVVLFIYRAFGTVGESDRQNTRKSRFIGNLRNCDLLHIDHERLQHTELQIEIGRAVLCGDHAGDFVFADLNRKLLCIAELHAARDVGNKGVGNPVIVARHRRIVGFQLDVPRFSVGFRRRDAVLPVRNFGVAGNRISFKLCTEQFSFGNRVFRCFIINSVVLYGAHGSDELRSACSGRPHLAADAHKRQDQDPCKQHFHTFHFSYPRCRTFGKIREGGRSCHPPSGQMLRERFSDRS